MVLDVAGYHGSAVRRVAVMLKGRVKLYCFVSSVSVYGDSSEERDAAFAAAGKTLLFDGMPSMHRARVSADYYCCSTYR